MASNTYTFSVSGGDVSVDPGLFCPDVVFNQDGVSRPTALSGSSAAYAGPGDIAPGASAWWGCRAYSFATIGNNAIKLRRDSDNTTMIFVTTSNGNLDVTSIASFKGAANLFVDTLYDQTGNGFDVGQATQANQFSFSLTGFGSLPAILPDGTSTKGLSSGAGPTISQPYTVTGVAERTSGANGQCIVSGSGQWVMFFDGSANNASFFSGGTKITVAANDNSMHSLIAIPPTTLLIDGSGTTGGSSGTNSQTQLFTVASGGGQATMIGVFCESGIWSGAFTGGQQSSMVSNQRGYWGF